MNFRISIVKDPLYVYRIPRNVNVTSDIMATLNQDTSFWSFTVTSEEQSLVVSGEVSKLEKLEQHLNQLVGIADLPVEKTWRSIKIEGPLDFGMIGVLSQFSTLLAQEGISIFAISTFDTDYILAKEEKFDSALKALQKNGCTLV